MKEELANKLYRTLLETGEVVCDSPVLRYLIYQKLKEGKIAFSTETEGDTGGMTSLNPYGGGIGYSAKRIMTWLRNGRIYKKDLLEQYDLTPWLCRYPVTYIYELYNKDTTHDRKYEIVKEMSEASNKYTIFDFVPLRKLVKKITLIESFSF